MKALEHTHTEEIQEVDVLDIDLFRFHLIVWNDDINTFEWVIRTLMEICHHDKEQAEQCTLLIHFKGKCSVKVGEYDMLKTMRDAITERGIGATVEELVS